MNVHFNTLMVPESRNFKHFCSISKISFPKVLFLLPGDSTWYIFTPVMHSVIRVLLKLLLDRRFCVKPDTKLGLQVCGWLMGPGPKPEGRIA